MTITREIPGDELVAKGAFVHLERMDDDEFFLVVDDQRYLLTATGHRSLEWNPEIAWLHERQLDDIDSAARLRGPRMIFFGCLFTAAFWAAVGLVVWWVL